MRRLKPLRWATHLYSKLGIAPLQLSRTPVILRSHSGSTGRSLKSYTSVFVSSSGGKLQSTIYKTHTKFY